jgi:TnpA family transposase
LFALLGRRFAPRLRSLKDRKFRTFEKPDTYPALKAHLGARINIDLRDHWDELLRMATSMNERIVAPSAILKKLSASKKPSELARALREVGRLERTRFMVE